MGSLFVIDICMCICRTGAVENVKGGIKWLCRYSNLFSIYFVTTVHFFLSFIFFFLHLHSFLWISTHAFLYIYAYWQRGSMKKKKRGRHTALDILGNFCDFLEYTKKDEKKHSCIYIRIDFLLQVSYYISIRKYVYVYICTPGI